MINFDMRKAQRVKWRKEEMTERGKYKEGRKEKKSNNKALLNSLICASCQKAQHATSHRMLEASHSHSKRMKLEYRWLGARETFFF